MRSSRGGRVVKGAIEVTGTMASATECTATIGRRPNVKRMSREIWCIAAPSEYCGGGMLGSRPRYAGTRRAK